MASGPRGPSAEEVSARKEQERRLKEQEEVSKRTAERARSLRIAGSTAQRRRQRGRSSLIATSELGTKESLG